MALLFYEGFDFPAANEPPEATWTWLDWNGGTTNWSYVAGRFAGSRAINCTNYARKPLGTNAATVIAGVAFKRQDANWPAGGDTAMNFIHFLDAATKQIEVRLMRGVVSGFRFQIWRGATLLVTSADLMISTGSYYYLEAKVTLHASAGSIEVRLNSAPIAGLTLTGINTISTANAYANAVGFASGAQGGSYGTHFDDIYCCDATGVWPWTDFLGEIRVETLALTSDVTKAFTPSTGTDNYAVIDELPMSIADFLSGSTTPLVDEYGLANLSTTPATIYAAGVVHNFDKTDVGVRTVRTGLRAGATILNGASRAPEVTPRRTWQDFWVADPNTGIPWTPAAINALQVRLENVT